MGSLLRKGRGGWCQVNALGREVSSSTPQLGALRMGKQGGLQFGAGKSTIIPPQKALCSADEACADVEGQPSPAPATGITACLTSQLLPGPRSPPAGAQQKRGGSLRIPTPATGPAPCPICQSEDGPHPVRCKITGQAGTGIRG